ncbi:hypothetical protein AB656_05310 [Bifidobacterium actinocoloniiforme DSM 22766]|nr:hypothetical protein AB656_05310 [Bifidobacterium actinocoloniiforme DSM 22766]
MRCTCRSIGELRVCSKRVLVQIAAIRTVRGATIHTFDHSFFRLFMGMRTMTADRGFQSPVTAIGEDHT